MRDDELISASFDGELLPAEQKRAVEKIQSNAKFQQEQQEIARVSKFLKDLPQKGAPPELLASVRQQVERESLLAEMPVTRPATSAPKPSSSTGIGLKAILITLACSVVALVSIPWLWQSRSEQGSVPEMAALEQQAESVVESLERGDGFINDKADIYSDEKVEGDGFFASRSNGVPSTERNQLNFRLAPTESLVTSNGTEIKMQDSLVEMEVGSTFEAKEVSGNQVSVVRLTVVDRVSSLQDFQILLQKHNINPEDINSEKSVASSREVNRQRVPGDADADADGVEEAGEEGAISNYQEDGLLAVYVSAPPEQLEAALEELKSAAFVEEEDFLQDRNETILADNLSVSSGGNRTEYFGAVEKRDRKGIDEKSPSFARSGTASEKVLPTPEKTSSSLEKETSKQNADFGVPEPRLAKNLQKLAMSKESESLKEEQSAQEESAPASGVQVTFHIAEQELENLIREEKARQRMLWLADPQVMMSMSNSGNGLPVFDQPQQSEKKVAGLGGAQSEKIYRYQVKDTPSQVRQHIIKEEVEDGILLHSRAVQKTAQVLFIIRTNSSRDPVPAEKPGDEDSSSLQLWRRGILWGNRPRLIG